MKGVILVPLGRSDPVEHLLPYLEDVARPGMKVVFLVNLGWRGFGQLAGQILAIPTGIHSACLPEGICKESLLANRRLSIEREVNDDCLALAARGVTIEVHGCAGRLGRVVQDYLQKEDVHLVMMPRGGSRVIVYLRKICSVLGLFRPFTLPPVLLLYPRNITEKYR